MGKLLYILRELRSEIAHDDATLVAGAVTFYVLLALFPFLVFVLTLTPYFVPPETVDQLILQIQALMPEQVADALTTEIERIVLVERRNVLAISFLFSLWSASGGIYAIMRALNNAYNVTETRSFLHKRGLALLGAIISTVAVLVGAVAIIVGDMVLSYLKSLGILRSLHIIALFQFSRFLVSILLVTLVWAFMYWFLPNRRSRYQPLTWGSTTGVLIWLLASIGFSIYVSRFGEFQATYGSLAAAIVTMLWIYVTSLAFLLGAEVNIVVDRGRRTGFTRSTAPDDHPSTPDSPAPGQGEPAREERARVLRRPEKRATETAPERQAPIQLARPELRQDLRSTGMGALIFTLGGFLGLAGLILFSTALSLLLSTLIGVAAAFLVIGAVWLTVFIVIYYRLVQKKD